MPEGSGMQPQVLFLPREAPEIGHKYRAGGVLRNRVTGKEDQCQRAREQCPARKSLTNNQRNRGSEEEKPSEMKPAVPGLPFQESAKQQNACDDYRSIDEELVIASRLGKCRQTSNGD